MPTTLTPRKIQKHFNMFFGEVNSLIGNVYKKLSHTPRFLHSVMNDKHKHKRTRHNHKKR